MFSDWYVLHVGTGRELSIKEKIESCSSIPIKLMVFQRTIVHTVKGEKHVVVAPLFPGYIFVFRQIREACGIAARYFPGEYISPVSVNSKPCRVFKEEMDMLLQSSDNNGIFQLSRGVKVGDRVNITSGPLKDLPVNILWVNEKKSKARVEMSLFKQTLKINLGLDVVGCFV